MFLFSRGCQNGAFVKRSFCRGDTRHFRHFRRFPGFEEQNPLFLWVECNIRISADFRQNHLFSAGDKTTVFQNDRFDNPDFRFWSASWAMLSRQPPASGRPSPPRRSALHIWDGAVPVRLSVSPGALPRSEGTHWPPCARFWPRASATQS